MKPLFPILVFFFIGGVNMNSELLRGNTKKLFIKYLLATLGSATVASIYGLADSICVGQYEGPNGLAALSVVMPVWTILYSLGLLTGVGGATIFGYQKGKRNDENANKVFTVSFLITSIVAFIVWMGLIFFDDELLRLFGADDVILPLAKKYITPIRFIVPFYPFTELLSAFLRNDNDPVLASKAVITGGIFNIIGDIFFTFTLDLGILGAGIATASGIVITVSIMLSHFFKKSNTIKLVKVDGFFKIVKNIIVIGFGAFALDLSMGFITILFNNQIGKLGPSYLAIYGIIVQLVLLVQTISYSIGQSSQALISVNIGAKEISRVKQMIKYSLITSFIIGFICFSLVVIFPKGFTKLFTKPTNEILELAPSLMRIFSISFIFLPSNIFITYYMQSINKPSKAIIITFLRGFLLPLIIINILPLINTSLVWYSMILIEIIVFLYGIFEIRKNKLI